ncbi:MAG: hypothetical protein AAFX08_10595 [Pseudomonadota bacterium]
MAADHAVRLDGLGRRRRGRSVTDDEGASPGATGEIDFGPNGAVLNRPTGGDAMVLAASGGRATSNGGRQFKIAALWAVFGPPFGAIALVVGGAGFGFASTALENGAALIDYRSMVETIGLILRAAPMLVVVSYPLGSGQALLAGLFLAVTIGRDGKVTFAHAFAAGVFAGLAAAPVIVYALDWGWGPARFLGGIGVVSSLLLRLVFAGVVAPRGEARRVV